MWTILGKYGEYFLGAATFILIAGPIIQHLFYGWKGKREEVLGILGNRGIESYFTLFFPAYLKDREDLESEFRDFYHRRFGRKRFIIPGILLAIVSGFLLFFASCAVFHWLRGGETQAVIEIPPIALAAFAGGYIWVLNDLFRRAHQRDMRPPHLFWVAFRLFISAPLGYAIAAILRDEAGIPIAILLGLFPTQTLMTMGRRIVQSRLKQTDLAGESGWAIEEELQGVGREQAERFRAERVSTIVQLAYSDPIDLTVRTNFPLSYVIDCCSQALAWLYFRTDLKKMQEYGLRGAQEIASLIAELDDNEQEETKKRAEKCIKTVLEKQTVKDPSTFERMLREVAEDPYTQFLCEVWCAGTTEEI